MPSARSAREALDSGVIDCGASSIILPRIAGARAGVGHGGIVNSSGSIVVSSSQPNGVDTWAPDPGRTPHAPNTFLCGAFWLKSMNTRSPRSSFHHLSVIRSGWRRASSRADAIAAPRTANESQPGSTPHVDVDALAAGGLGEAEDAELGE